MSWSRSQHNAQASLPPRQASPLAAMSAAAMLAGNRPVLEQTLAAIQQAMASLLTNIPTDIDWPAFQQGTLRYAANTAVPAQAHYPMLATTTRVSLLDAGGTGQPVVLIPSMVNRGYVLDLSPGHSLVEHLRNEGFHVLLIDWGTPTPDSALTLESIIADHLEPLLTKAYQQYGPLTLFGYCMGGLLATAAAVRLNTAAPGTVTKLAVAAMPWDFTATVSASHMQTAKPLLEPWLTEASVVPPEIMAHYFWSLDPWSPIRRLMAYGRETDPTRLTHMTALEDWLNDGLPLDGPVAREMLLDWYIDNAPARGTWHIRGTPINPANAGCPLWVCITQNDLLVPTASSLPFLAQTRGAQVVMSDTGHIGLVCGRRAKERLYTPLTHWLNS